jgi:hypothetical protein
MWASGKKERRKKKKKRESNESEKGEDSQGASKIAGRESSSWWNSIIREVTQPQSSRGDRSDVGEKKLGMEQVGFAKFWLGFVYSSGRMEGLN